MDYELRDLIVDRIDFVDEGANSAAHIELYKRKETVNSMDFEQILEALKPEHAEVVKNHIAAKDEEIAKACRERDEAAAELAKANDEIGVLKAKDAPVPSEDEVLKSMPESARAVFLKMREDLAAADERERLAKEKAAHDVAVSKAASLKAIPIEQEKLVGILKSCTPEYADLLSACNAAIEATVLNEVGKSRGTGATDVVISDSDDAWAQLEKRADEIAKRDNVTKEKGMVIAMRENPDLYRAYINGGAK